jgi:hypothetical protein
METFFIEMKDILSATIVGTLRNFYSSLLKREPGRLENPH